MKRNQKAKKWIISAVALVLVAAIGLGVWYYAGHSSAEPVNVYRFYEIGMTEYWGDSRESYGPVTTDRIQTVFLSDTQTVTEIFVAPGDTVKKGDLLMTFDTTLSDLALERERLENQIGLEERSKSLVAAQVENERSRASQQTEAAGALMQVYNALRPEVLEALSLSGMDARALIARAFLQIGENAQRIGNLNISPDLLQTLTEG